MRDSSAVADLMTCVLARQVRADDVVGVGLGTPLALCACLLARRLHAPSAEILVAGALSPAAGLLDCLRGPSALAGRTPGYVPHLDSMDMAERRAMTLQFLRPAQVDGSGCLNTSQAGGVRLPGGLATADVPNLLPRVVAYHTDHGPRGLPRRVDFVTGARGSLAALVTDRCVIAFGHAGPALVSVHPGEDEAAVRAATGFELEPGTAPLTPIPSADELAALDEIDPLRLRQLELKAKRAAAAERLAAAATRERSARA